MQPRKLLFYTYLVLLVWFTRQSTSF